jgi:hypothetical protein
MGAMFEKPCAVAVRSIPDHGTVRVYVSGVVDPVATPVLADAVDQIRTIAPDTVVIDVAAVTFACSTLANFVTHVGRAAPQASLAVVHGTPLIHRILTATGVNVYLTNDHFSIRSGAH